MICIFVQLVFIVFVGVYWRISRLIDTHVLHVIFRGIHALHSPGAMPQCKSKGRFPKILLKLASPAIGAHYTQQSLGFQCCWLHVLMGCQVVLSYCAINSLRGYCTPNLKLACFVCYLKIINTFFVCVKNNICILKKIVQGTQKWHCNFSGPGSF